MDDELFTAVDVDPPSKQSRRYRSVAACVTLVGALVIVGTGTAFAVQAGHTVIDNLTTGESPEYIPLPEREDAALPAVVPPTPGANGSGSSRTNAYGTPLYDVNSDPALIVYPVDMPEYLRQTAELVVAQNFIIAECMANQGHDYVFALDWERTAADEARGKGIYEGPAEGTPEYIALRGTAEPGEGYRWQDGGCDGYSVYATGMDGQH